MRYRGGTTRWGLRAAGCQVQLGYRLGTGYQLDDGDDLWRLLLCCCCCAPPTPSLFESDLAKKQHHFRLPARFAINLMLGLDCGTSYCTCVADRGRIYELPSGIDVTRLDCRHSLALPCFVRSRTPCKVASD